MNELEKAKELLTREHYTFASVCGDSVLYSNERGVKPLLELLDKGIDLAPYSAADKVIGKAAAFLYVLLGAKVIYADIISESALKVLQKNEADITYRELVPAVRNRTNTGFCPMETAVKNTDDPDEALILIRNKLKELNSR